MAWFTSVKETSSGGNDNYKDITGTLTSGQTNLTIENSIISDKATYDFYTDVFGVNPTDVVISEPKVVVLRQELVPQESDLSVTVTANNNWTGFDPWKAFGDSSVNNAGWIGNGGNPHWLQIEFPSETSLLYMDFISRDANRSHAVSRVGYSDDGINFTECGITESTMVNNEGHVELDTDYTAKYFRLYFDGSYNYNYQSYPMVAELLLYGKDTDPTGTRSITLTFEPQSTKLGVKVRVWGGNAPQPYTSIDMSGIQKFVESSMDYIPTTSAITSTYITGGSAIGATCYMVIPIDVTNYTTLKYELVTRTCYGGGSTAQQERWNVMIGLMQTAPSNIINTTYDNAGFVAGDDFANSNTNYGTQEIDVSNLTGDYYFVIASHGWNATISNLRAYD